jgi:hypothetical protein
MVPTRTRSWISSRFPVGLVLLASLASARSPQSAAQGPLVRVGDRAYPLNGASGVPEALRAPLRVGGRFQPGVFVVHFASPTTAADRSWLDDLTGAPRRADGSRLARAYLPDDAWLVQVDDPATWSTLLGSERLDRVVRYHPAFKLDAIATEAVLASEAGAPRAWTVDLVPGYSHKAVTAELVAGGARLLERFHHRGQGLHDLDLLVIEARAQDWLQLARVEGIRSIRLRTPEDPSGSELVAWLARAERGDLTCAQLAERPAPSPYDGLAALADLLAHDDPSRVVRVPGAGLEGSALQPAVKNTLALRDSRLLPAGLTDEDSGRPSAALVRARRIEAELRADAGATDGPRPLVSRTSLERDVDRAAGFRGPEDRPQVLQFECSGDPGDALDVVLAWTDEPGTLGTLGDAIDDLDLVVWSPDGLGYRGNRLDASGASRPGATPDARLTAERVHLPDPIPGTWTAVVSARRGAFSRPQGYALRVSGPGVESSGTSQGLSAPVTELLPLIAGVHSQNGALGAVELAQLGASDDVRFDLRDRASLILSFANTLPPEAIVTGVRVGVEHHELPRINAGDVQWRFGQGTLANPALSDALSAPVHDGPAAETLDVWRPTGFDVLQGDVILVVENDSTRDDTLLDRTGVLVDYFLPDPVPTIVSIPNPGAIVGEPYLYDADGRAEAEGTAPFTWSVVTGPTGFSIDVDGLVTWTPLVAGSFDVVLRVDTTGGSQDQAFTVVVEQPPFPATLLPAEPANQTYCPPERLSQGGSKGQQRLNVFLPPGPAPVGGWPVVMNNRAGGGLASSALTLLEDTGTTAPLHAFVASGVAVVDYGVTGIGNGNGLFYPPGHFAGHYESFAPGDDTPEKDAEWALQWIKTQTLFPLDVDRICLRGASQGAIINMWASMGPSRSRSGGSAQVRANTRVRAVLALQPPTSVWAFDQTSALQTRMHQHYQALGQPGVPATAFEQVAKAFQTTSSIMGFAFQSLAARTHNATQAVCLLYAEPVSMNGAEPADMTLDADGYPNLHDTLRSPFIHDSWSGYVLYKRLLGLSPDAAAFHAEHSTFAIRSGSALPAPNDIHTRTFQSNVFGAEATAIAHAWVLRELASVTRTQGQWIQPGN